MTFWDQADQIAWATAARVKNVLRAPAMEAHAQREPAPAPLVAYYVAPDGKMHAVKSGMGNFWGGGYYSALGAGNISSSPEGYAYASLVSVWAGRCIYLRAQTINRLDWHVRNKKTKDRIEGHPLQVALERNSQRIMRKYEWSQNIWGETFIRPRRNDYGYYSDLTWINNLGMEVDTSMGYVSAFRYQPVQGRNGRVYSPHEIAFIHNDNPFDDLRGVSPFEQVLVEVGIDRDIARTTKSFYANDARPGLILIPETDVGNPQEFTDYWNANFRGPDNAGKAVMMPRNIKEVKEIQQRPNIDDVELRESVRREICAGFGVPLSIAGAWDDAQYQSAPEQRKSFYEETIIPRAEEIAQDMTSHVLPYFDDSTRNEVYFEADTILALTENQHEQVATANAQLLSGAITLNQYLAKTGDETLGKRGEVYYIPANVTVVPARELGRSQPPPEPPPAAPVVEREPRLQLPAPEQQAETPPIRAHTCDVVTIPDTIHKSALDELTAWERANKNARAKGKDKYFQNYLIRDDIADALRAALDEAIDDVDAIKAAFVEARVQVEVKAIQATRLDFENEFETLLSAARTGDVKRREWAARLRTFIRRYGERAYRDGLNDGGVVIGENEPLEPDDSDQLKIMLAQQSQYVTDFGDSLFNGDGVSDKQAALKPAQWFNKSILPIYHEALRSADKNGMFEYAGPKDENSCATCFTAAGQRHRLKDWARHDIIPPHGGGIICSDGGNCRHTLSRVNAAARGRLDGIKKR